MKKTDDDVKKTEAKIKNKRSMKKKVKKKNPPIMAMLGSTFVLVLAIWGMLQPENFDFLFSNMMIEEVISSSADEDDWKKNAETKDKKSAKNSTSTQVKGNQKEKNTDRTKEENLNYLSKLHERKQKLDQRERELNELEAELHKQKSEIEAKIKNLAQVRRRIASALKEKVEVDNKKVNTLVQFYSNMKPVKAAKILSRMNEDLAVEVLGRMKKKGAANIMNLLEPEKAQVLSEKFAGYKR